MNMKSMAGAAIIVIGGLAAGSASADPWKDESGNRRDRGAYQHDQRGYDRGDNDRRGYDRGNYEGRDYDRRGHERRDHDRGYTASPPRGHLPPPGQCRVWYDNRPAGHQPAPMNCEQANRVAARTGGEVISSRGRVRTAPYADRYGGDASYRAPAQCYAYDRNGVCIR